MLSLLDTKSERKPLAEAIRPKDFEHVYGQEHLLAPNSQITHMLNSKHITNMIFWGPPGSGKTTMARILAEKSGYHFESISAVVSGTAHFKEVFEKTKVSAALAASIFHFGEIPIPTLKNYLKQEKINIRI